MKKILRMALVLALAGSALLYTSCTKDYSPDIKSLQEQIDGINNNTDGLPWVRTQLQGLQNDISGLRTAITNGDQALDTKIGNLDTKLTNAINSINDAIAKKADKTYVDGALSDLNDAIDDLKTDLEARLDAIDGDEGRLAAIEEAIDSLGSASEAIEGLFETYAKFIQSLAYVPATTDGFVEANAYKFVDGSGLSDTLVVATFKVTPPDARLRATDESANLVAVATKAAAAAPDTLAIKKIVYREDAPGYVDVFATLGGLKVDANNGLAIALAVEQKENDVLESVTSDYAPLKVGADQDILFQIYDAEDSDIIDPSGFTEDEPVRVSPSSPSDSVCVFTEGRWSIVADIAGSYMTPAEAKDLFGVKDIKKVSPVAGDTVYSKPMPTSYYDYKPLAFESTVFPVRPKTVIDLVVSGNTPAKLGIAVKNSHAGTVPSGWAYGIYMAVPDTVALTLTPQDVHEGTIDVIIPWDYKYYNDIKDTLIAKIHVDGNRDGLVGADTTLTWNAETNVDYTQAPKGAVTAHTNDDTAIDAVLVSKAEYGKADSTYVYSIQKFDKTDATEYVGEFEYLVEARPADAVIELGPIDTIVSFDNDTKVEVEAIKAAYALHEEYYQPYVLDTVAADAVAGKFGAKRDSIAVYLDGKKVGGEELIKGGDFGFADGKETTNFSLRLNKPGEWKVYVYTHFANVGYTFVVTINAEPNPARIAPKTTFVTVESAENPKDYSVEVLGDVDTSGTKTGSKWHYYLVDQPFQDYLKVVSYAAGSDSLVMDLITATARAKDAATAVATDFTSPVELVRYEADKTQADLKDKTTYMWDKYDSLQFKVAARLVAASDTTLLVDSATVRLWTADPIPVFDGGEEIVALHTKDSLTKVNIIAGIKIEDFNGIALNDENGLITTFGPNADGDIVVNYDQAIEVGDYKIVGGVDHPEDLADNLKLDKTTGVLTLDYNQGKIVKPIEVEIPIKLTYMLDQGLEAKNEITVKVVIKEKE